VLGGQAWLAEGRLVGGALGWWLGGSVGALLQGGGRRLLLLLLPLLLEMWLMWVADGCCRWRSPHGDGRC
jgi:hypothetical protein